MKVILAILFFVTGARACQASLEWKSLENEVFAEFGAQEVTATFAFHNSGDYAVNIGNIVPSCGCTAVELEDKTIAPGESGEVNVIFNIGSREGLNLKKIHVHTDDIQAPVVELTLKCFIEKFAEVLPRVLIWTKGEVGNEKHFTIRNNRPGPFYIEDIDLDTDAFSHRLKKIEGGRAYQLIISPKSTKEKTQMKRVPFIVRSKDERKEHVVYVAVK